MSHRTRSRILASIGSVALVVGLLTVATTPANAGFTLKPRTYTAAMSPLTAVPGQPTDYTVVVTNTSTRLSGLDHFELVVPSGFSVTAGSVIAPRGGWTESVSGGRVITQTKRPLSYALRMGESMTVGFTATATAAAACTSTTAAWVQRADGIIVDPWLAQSADPRVQLSVVADRFVVTSVTDGSTPPLDHKVVQGAGFTTTGQFRCGAVAAPVGVDSTLTLTKKSAGDPDRDGQLGGTLGATVHAGDTSAVISGTTYSQVENAVGIGVAWDAGTGDSYAIDVLGAADTSNGAPGSVLSVVGATTTLTAGADGPVSLTVNGCDAQNDSHCSNGSEIELDGVFKDDQGANLYGFGTAAVPGVTPLPTDLLAPLQVSRICSASVCPNRHNGSAHFGQPEAEQDFNAYPTFVSLRLADGSETPFVQAPRCAPLPKSKWDPFKGYLLSVTGKMLTPEAQRLGFCIDVNAISRVGNRCRGDLKLPVLFVEDLKLRP